eukprot:GFUD01069625.1.p1 GENE.GFUD01069625.1~~GFUD01069625.1.p1  ORF type:complete len:169 (-),score=49.04 GFUD01069625.1:356-862(-)
MSTPEGKPGAIESLASFLDMKGSECLNESDDHPFSNCLKEGDSVLQSDCDEQLILSLAFNQVVKVHSIKLHAPSAKGPKTVRVFKNQPRTLDFSQAESMTSIQDLELSGGQLDGKEIPLKFVKFQDVQNIQLFVRDNQTGDEVTQIDFLELFGTPKQTTNMKELKKAG